VRHPERRWPPWITSCDYLPGAPFADPLAENNCCHLGEPLRGARIRLHGIGSGRQGIVHVIAPELVSPKARHDRACGDSHTPPRAFGAIAFGHFAPARVRDVLAAQSLSIDKLKACVAFWWKPAAFWCVRKGLDPPLDSASRGSKGGVGYAYEYCFRPSKPFSMEERMPSATWR